ncbi:hypothetical protein CYMTET_5900 [Cymbomonas tetramitiformis]|uniref:Mediator complex subunit 8 n=1 Tax=Cymbomonas tetramitiformis TaxID=36881 RepID=A0AAE0GY84_9CHLO|nr:hypothetical protein CYMTET_5900 [Cymbomonas tetramitiformis]
MEKSEDASVGQKRAAPAAESSELQFLTSSSDKCLNLTAVKTRAEGLRKGLQRVMAEIEFTNPREITWESMVAHFAVLSTQIDSLTKELRPLLKNYVAHPVDVSAQIAQDIPILLSTKLLPEMEKEETELLKQYRKSVIGQPIGDQYFAIQTKIDQYNQLCQNADDVLKNLQKDWLQGLIPDNKLAL